MARPRPSDEQMAEALKETRGMVYVAAKRLECSPTTILSRLKQSATLRQVKEDAKGLLTDQAETKLIDAIMAGDPWAVQFYLKTQAKDRGYVEKTETEQSGGMTITVKYADAGTDPNAPQAAPSPGPGDP